MHATGWIRLVAWYEIVAGLLGVLLALAAAPRLVGQLPPEHRQSAVLVFALIGALFVVLALAGFLLARGHRWGRALSLALQWAQAPVVSLGVFRWVFFGGAYLVPAWRPEGSTLLVGLKSNLEINWGPPSLPALVGLNLVPLFIIWALHRSAERQQPAVVVDEGNERAATDAPAI
jgi:hypothetical protein